MSYGPDLDERFSRVAALVDHILNRGQPRQPAVRAADAFQVAIT